MNPKVSITGILLTFLLSISLTYYIAILSTSDSQVIKLIDAKLQVAIKSKTNIDDYNEHHYLAIKDRLFKLLRDPNITFSACIRTIVHPFDGSLNRTGKLVEVCSREDLNIDQIINGRKFERLHTNTFKIKFGNAILGDIEYYLSYSLINMSHLLIILSTLFGLLGFHFFISKYLQFSESIYKNNGITNNDQFKAQENTINLLKIRHAQFVISNNAPIIKFEIPVTSNRKSKVVIAYDENKSATQLPGSLNNIINSKYGSNYVKINRFTIVSIKYLNKFEWTHLDDENAIFRLNISRNTIFENLDVGKGYFDNLIDILKKEGLSEKI